MTINQASRPTPPASAPAIKPLALAVSLLFLGAVHPVVQAASGIADLGMLNGTYSYAYGVNAAGDVVVGTAADGSAGNAARAFRWTQAGGMVSLGTLNGGIDSAAYGVNAAGDVVVGTASDGSAGNANRAFRWTQANSAMRAA